jgi:hypothetical protein
MSAPLRAGRRELAMNDGDTALLIRELIQELERQLARLQREGAAAADIKVCEEVIEWVTVAVAGNERRRATLH